MSLGVTLSDPTLKTRPSPAPGYSRPRHAVLLARLLLNVATSLGDPWSREEISTPDPDKKLKSDCHTPFTRRQRTQSQRPGGQGPEPAGKASRPL